MGLHVVNASVAEPLFRQLPLSLGRAESLLESCFLSPGLLDSATGLIPLHAAEEFVFRVQRASGDPCFTFDVVKQLTQHRGGKVANIPVRGAQVALDGVRDFVAALDGVLTGTRFWLHLDRDQFWILRTTATTQWSDSWALVFYNLSIVIHGLRCLLGPDIRPKAVAVACDQPSAVLPEALTGIPLTLGAKVTGLAFDRALLARAMPQPSRHERDDQEVYRALSLVDCEGITQCLRGLLASETTNRLSDRAARAFGLSRRSYQRHLQGLGTSHRALVDDARLVLALELFTDDAWSITQIAQELGYRHPGDFTRFIRRRTGLSPRELRMAIAQDATAPPLG